MLTVQYTNNSVVKYSGIIRGQLKDKTTIYLLNTVQKLLKHCHKDIDADDIPLHAISGFGFFEIINS